MLNIDHTTKYMFSSQKLVTRKRKQRTKRKLEFFPKMTHIHTCFQKNINFVSIVFSFSLSIDDHNRFALDEQNRDLKQIFWMVRHFPSNDRILMPIHIGFWPEDPPPTGEVSTRDFSSRLPVVCRHVHSKQPFGMFRGENAMNYAFSTFLIEAILIIFFIKITCFLLRPLRQPRIVCEIIVRH